MDNRRRKGCSRYSAQSIFETKPIADYLHSLWPGMNELTEWLGMSMEENKEMTYSAVRCMGLEVPPDEDNA